MQGNNNLLYLCTEASVMCESCVTPQTWEVEDTPKPPTCLFFYLIFNENTTDFIHIPSFPAYIFFSNLIFDVLYGFGSTLIFPSGLPHYP